MCESCGLAEGSRNQNLEPSPQTLSTPMVPPISSISCLEMASPSPVPPKRRVVVESAWKNFSNRLARAGTGMPTPVSVMLIVTPPSASCVALMPTLPRSVNFSALLTRLSSTWRTRAASPSSRFGQSLGKSTSSRIPLATNCGRTRAATSSMLRRTSNGSRTGMSLPASIFETSRMSLMTLSRLCPEEWIVSTHSR